MQLGMWSMFNSSYMMLATHNCCLLTIFSGSYRRTHSGVHPQFKLIGNLNKFYQEVKSWWTKIWFSKGGCYLQWSTHVRWRSGGERWQGGKDQVVLTGKSLMLFFLTKRCWPLLDISSEEQQELKVSCPQVKWGPVYTLFSDYNVVVLYDGTFVEVNQLQRSKPQLP